MNRRNAALVIVIRKYLKLFVTKIKMQSIFTELNVYKKIGKNLSGVGFEPTPPDGDQNAH